MRMLLVPAAIVLVGVVLLVGLTGRGSSVAGRVKDATGAHVACDRVGLMVVAGKREKVYACRRDDGAVAGCYAVASGDLVDVSVEASQVDAGFDCS